MNKIFKSFLALVLTVLILGTAITMFMSTVIGFGSIGDTLSVDFKSVIIFATLIAITVIVKLAFKKKQSPILMILISDGLGMVMYSI